MSRSLTYRKMKGPSLMVMLDILEIHKISSVTYCET